MTLTISVILATHDRPASLARAVEAVLAQSRLPEEVIIGLGTVESECDRHSEGDDQYRAQEEQGIGVIRIRTRKDAVSLLVGKGYIHIHIFQGDMAKSVIDSHVGIKGLTLEGELLVDLQFYPCTYGVISSMGRNAANGSGATMARW